MIFYTTKNNDKLYTKNGQTVDILEDDHSGYCWVRFEDGTEASVSDEEILLTSAEAREYETKRQLENEKELSPKL